MGAPARRGKAAEPDPSCKPEMTSDASRGSEAKRGQNVAFAVAFAVNVVLYVEHLILACN